MTKYQVMFIIRPDLSEEQYDGIVEEMSAVFTNNNSEVTDVKKWGLRDLAYEIDDLKKGYYVLFEVNATNEAVVEYNRISVIKEDIIRHIIVKD